jgi:hypothetical protein
MAVKNQIAAVPLSTFASANVTGAYQAISTALPNSCFLLRIINASNKDITISFDGINDGDYIVSGTNISLNGQTNSQPNNFIANWPIGTTVYAKGTAGTGNVYVAGYYQPSAG